MLGQRAENGGLDLSSLDLLFWGAQISSPEAPQVLILKGLERFGATIWGASNANSTTTDPIPHSQPSELDHPDSE